MKELFGYTLVFLIIIAALGGFVYVARGFLKGWGDGTIGKTGKVTGGSVSKGGRNALLWIGGLLAGIFLVGGVSSVLGVRTENNFWLGLAGLSIGLGFSQILLKKYAKK